MYISIADNGITCNNCLSITSKLSVLMIDIFCFFCGYGQFGEHLCKYIKENVNIACLKNQTTMV